jgi:hypothetical protein
MPLIAIFAACTECEKTSGNIDDSVNNHLETGSIDVKIDFFTQYNSDSEAPLNIDTIFTLHDKCNLRTNVEIENIRPSDYPVHLFHFDWIDADDKSIFIKKFELSPKEVVLPLTSSMSISPDKRSPGNYKLKVYCFRKLIAEKSFRLLPENTINTMVAQRFNPQIVFGKSIHKKSGFVNDRDTLFNINQTRRIHALVDFSRPDFYENQNLIFTLKWISPDGNSFFEKEIKLSAGDVAHYLASSISVSADKRPVGEYRLRVFLFDELIAEKHFFLADK